MELIFCATRDYPLDEICLCACVEFARFVAAGLVNWRSRRVDKSAGMTRIRIRSFVHNHMRAVAVRKDLDELILDAADRLLGRYGYRKMTIDDIAREVGIGKGTIYLHFQSKEEIALAGVDRLINRLNARLREIAMSTDSASERLRLMLLERVLYRFDSVQHYAESLSDLLAAIRPALMLRHQRHFTQEAEIFVQVLKDGRKKCDLNFRDAKATAGALLSATNALLPYSLSTRELGQRSEVEDQVSRIAELLINGLTSAKS
jgi:AcrR family transcriptional regulator